MNSVKMPRGIESIQCPKCKAWISSATTACPECKLLTRYQNPQSDDELLTGNDGPENPLARLFWGLGITFDLWLILGSAILWFLILCFTQPFSYAVFATVTGFGLPALLILFSGPLSDIPFFKFPLREIDPVAIRLFAWVYLVGAHFRFAYQLFG